MVTKPCPYIIPPDNKTGVGLICGVVITPDKFILWRQRASMTCVHFCWATQTGEMKGMCPKCPGVIVVNYILWFPPCFWRCQRRNWLLISDYLWWACGLVSGRWLWGPVGETIVEFGVGGTTDGCLFDAFFMHQGSFRNVTNCLPVWSHIEPQYCSAY